MILEKENELLRKELGRGELENTMLVTRLYGYRDHWFVDVGCREGVQSGTALTREGSLIGEVQNIFDRYGSVRTLRDPSWRLPVQVGTASARGLFQVATGMPEVQEIAAAAPVAEGDVVITLGVGQLPPGLIVGKVSSTQQQFGAGTQKVRVDLAYEPEDVSLVTLRRTGEGNACP